MAATKETEHRAARSMSYDRLGRVRVLGLFGMFDHDIPLNIDSGITVIHGPNGVGKTIVLRMIHELLSTEPDVLARVPFDRLELEFESGDTISLLSETSTRDDVIRNVLKYECVLNSKSHVGTLSDPDPNAIRQVTSLLGESWRYKGLGQWIDRRDGEIVVAKDLKHRLNLPSKVLQTLRRKHDAVLDEIRKKCKVRLIRTERLLSEVKERDPKNEFSFVQRHLFSGLLASSVEKQTIAVYSKDLTQRFHEALSKYGTLTEKLDRSFVQRLVLGNFQQDTAQELLTRFKALDDKRRRLIDLGLLTETEELILGERAGDEDVLKLVSRSSDVFSLYVLDMQEKLALFDKLQNKLQILRDRTDQRFQFKKLIIDPSEGFVFESNVGKRIAASNLSSGEQHEMILFYELLFLAEQGNLVFDR